MATGRTVDSKIKAGSNTIQRIVASGSEIYRVVVGGVVRYDRKDYTLNVASGYRYTAPVTGGPITLSSTAVTSTYDGYNETGTRVNGASVSYTISPSSLSSNAHNTTQRTGMLTIQQDNSGLEVSEIPYTQSADAAESGNVCTSLTVTLTNVPVIPASGGSVNSCDVSVVANGYVEYQWISGDSTVGPSTSWTLNSSDYTLSWSGVTAQSKGTSASTQTSAGTLQCEATFSGITGSGETTVYQAANQIEGYTSWEYELSVSTNIVGNYPAAGGNITVDYSGIQKRKPIYTSTATGSTYSYRDAECILSANTGYFDSNAVSGTGSATFTLGANTGNGNRTVTIALMLDSDHTKKATTSFTQSYSTYSYAYAYLSNYTGYGQLNTWEQVHDVSQNISNWSSPSQDVYAVTEAGNTVYRTGTTTLANPVQPDTYFYENDSLTFYTRNVTTAGAAGTEHLWYKNPNWTYNVPTNIDATATTFTMSFSLNTKFYVTVKNGTTTVMSKTLYTGGTLTVNCGANTSTTTDRLFDVIIEDYYDVEYTDMYNLQVTQSKKVAPSISIDHNSWTYECGPLNSDVVIVNSVGTGWYASYDANYFSVSPASGNSGSGQNVVITALQRGTTSKDINFQSNELAGGRARYTVSYEQC